MLLYILACTPVTAMKKTMTLLGLLAALGTSAVAETLWVYGASEQGGWYDADKVSSADDLNKCWAAVSSNLINWWQSQYEIPETYESNNTIYTAPSKDADAVWKEYRRKTTTVQGNVEQGLNWWWMANSSSPFTNVSSAYWYYTSQFLYPTYTAALTGYQAKNYVYTIEPENTDLSQYLYEALTTNDARKGIGINIGSSQSASFHGVTMWGAEFNEALELVALWLTDSDDAILNAEKDLELFKVKVEKRENGYYMADYWYETARYIESITVLDAARIDEDWGAAMQRVYLIPEPASATLSLLALGCLAVRRRRI